MESEHLPFPSTQQAADEVGNRPSEPTLNEQETAHNLEAPPQTEATSATRRRRWRPSRSSTRHGAASAEHPAAEAQEAEAQSETQATTAQARETEAPAATGETQEAISSQQEYQSAGQAVESAAASATAIETGGDLTPPAPTPQTLNAEEAPLSPGEEAALPPSLEPAHEGIVWQEPLASAPAPAEEASPALEAPPTPQAAQEETPPAEPTEAAGDVELLTIDSSTAEAAPAGDAETMAPLPQKLPPEPAAAPPAVAPEAQGEVTYEPVRAPLSGVEVRPPRRYRFDRPASPVHQETETISQAKPTAQPVQPSAAQPVTPPAAPQPAAQMPDPHQPAAHAAPPHEEPDLGAAMERELTETPEVEDQFAAAEELARATQAALEEEVAEVLESFTQQEAQAASSRSSRRRRRRSSSSAAASAEQAQPIPEKAQPAQPPPSTSQLYPGTNQFYPVTPPPTGQTYQVTNGLQQIGQPQSPFAGPEPSSARGFGPVPRGVATPAERSVRLPKNDRTIDTGNVTLNQLAMIFTQAIQQQTDRLLMELRRNQGVPSMTVNFPPLPSNERIGIFVDVANLLYSARNMRIAIDFGRLLDFLRGNRRLVRAHAYCPTSPDPRAEQMFLDAVKGLGYRITTKNYKTFSSGAKKADLDLDLCMDIVRLVDAKAVDCISLVSGDSDFLPLLEYCSDHGVRVEVAAFDEATASILRQSCDLFINLSLVEEIRA